MKGFNNSVERLGVQPTRRLRTNSFGVTKLRSAEPNCGQGTDGHFKQSTREAPLRRLHGMHRSWRLSKSFVPPRETGRMWSTSMRFSRIDVPQCWQVPRCIRNNADRIQRGIGALVVTAPGFLLRCLLSDLVFLSDHCFRGRRGLLYG